ncbi:MAG: DUF962 domain-containing protein [Candidatus Obscuribacter sp.]|jgi:hypothetical protein|nr:DUF962 domain-containing protein [Candidatus Obscuribacter sp.]MDQ5965612.1 hypothetical protein [Cyanobacteriota bacterium erpe_2018_sw_39hr_WHONDRS-SW48-000098_B_bin.30]MBK7837367.1 DUF962 domain-containing protein [Candidatus Obscuribacter sp.]MBK9206192.1 DUF962 domain-containing protein [Candidatus Obscuribacter sp.]MBK9618101.1 DUF962 domain-containing protein [Candidatus Obscuribacter sp.]
MKTESENLAYYRSQHRTPGCRITHMVGVPLIIAASLTSLVNRKKASKMFAVGYFLQISGHIFFEKNMPVLEATHDPKTLLSSVIFVAEQWQDVFEGTWLQKNDITRLGTPQVSPVVVIDVTT